MTPTSDFPRLETPRLVLRQFELSDGPAVQRLAGAFEVADTTINIPHPYAEGMAERWIATHRQAADAREGLTLAVILREGGELCGAVGLTIKVAHAHAELGYWIGAPFWNRGLATEAARAIVAYGFTELGLHRVHASHFSRNPASGRVMQKLGMRHEGRLCEHVRKWDRFEDLEKYGLLRAEWAAG